jgi:hypothetical protein
MFSEKTLKIYESTFRDLTAEDNVAPVSCSPSLSDKPFPWHRHLAMLYPYDGAQNTRVSHRATGWCWYIPQAADLLVFMRKMKNCQVSFVLVVPDIGLSHLLGPQMRQSIVPYLQSESMTPFSNILKCVYTSDVNPKLSVSFSNFWSRRLH